MKQDIKIIFENGIEINGKSFGHKAEVIGDFIFNTSIVGYQEVLTDPSYHKEIVVMTFPSQGIYGINLTDHESNHSSPLAFIVSHQEENYSNNHAKMSLKDYLAKKKIVGVEGIDTRYLTKLIRENGSMKGAIVPIEANKNDVISKIKNHQLKNHVLEVSPKKIKNSTKKKNRIVFYDFGAKDSIQKELSNRGYEVIKVPWNTKYSEVKKLKPELIFLSNGPGDPAELKTVVTEIKKMIKDNMKICGICLGHQLIAIAGGCTTERLKFGHHSTNHPVQDVETNKVYITSQNHNYAVKDSSVPKNIKPFLRSLHDNTISGLKFKNKNIISVQFHPESSPGPRDANSLFDLMLDYDGSQNA